MCSVLIRDASKEELLLAFENGGAIASPFAVVVLAERRKEKGQQLWLHKEILKLLAALHDLALMAGCARVCLW